jgi:hypothetical protein
VGGPNGEGTWIGSEPARSRPAKKKGTFRISRLAQLNRTDQPAVDLFYSAEESWKFGMSPFSRIKIAEVGVVQEVEHICLEPQLHVLLENELLAEREIPQVEPWQLNDPDPCGPASGIRRVNENLREMRSSGMCNGWD